MSCHNKVQLNKQLESMEARIATLEAELEAMKAKLAEREEQDYDVVLESFNDELRY